MANTLQIEHWAIVWFCQWWFVRACTRNSDARRNKNTNNSITLNTHNVKIVRRDFYAFFNVLQSSVVVFVVHLLTRNVYAEIDCFHMYVVMIIVTEFPFFFSVCFHHVNECVSRYAHDFFLLCRWCSETVQLVLSMDHCKLVHKHQSRHSMWLPNRWECVRKCMFCFSHSLSLSANLRLGRAMTSLSFRKLFHIRLICFN